jgi:hypothetical protein
MPQHRLFRNLVLGVLGVLGLLAGFLALAIRLATAS